MSASRMPYAFLLSALLLFNLFIFLTPYLASQGDANAPLYYSAFAPTCHQLTSRSLCLFKSGPDGSFSIGDCFESSELSYSRVNEVSYPDPEERGSSASQASAEAQDRTGYKIPVCSRDVAIYGAMLLGLVILPFIMKIETDDWPNKWLLVAAAVPVAIDGTGQLLGIWESTNLSRLWTGAIIGIVLPFYLLPIINSLYSFIQEKWKENFGKANKREK